jgi:hypothetical protein
MRYATDSLAITLASCAGPAADIVRHTLASSAKFKGAEVQTVPLLSRGMEYADAVTLVESAFRTTRELFAVNPGASLAISVMHESLSVASEGYPLLRQAFSVGLVTIYWTNGPLGVVQAKDWVPESKAALLKATVSEIFWRLERDCKLSPPGELRELGVLLGATLEHRIRFDVAEETVRVH